MVDVWQANFDLHALRFLEEHGQLVGVAGMSRLIDAARNSTG
jgi:hypothetical protein